VSSALSNVSGRTALGRAYGDEVPGSIQSIERAAAVLSLLAAAHRQLRLVDVSTALGLPKGTVHGILRTLTELGWVEQNRASGRYQLGGAPVDAHVSDLDVNELRARSMNWADPLAARSGEAVRIAVLADAEVLVVHYVFRPDGTAQTADVGARLPSHATALGKVLLAHLPGRGDLSGAELSSYTARTVTDPARLSAELSQTVSLGHAVEVGEHLAGGAGIAAPIRDFGGLVVAAVGVHGNIDRLCDTTGRPRAAVVRLVRDCARSISRELESARVERAAR